MSLSSTLLPSLLQSGGKFSLLSDVLPILIDSLRFRIGGAAQTATHCAVFAQLYIKGVCYGTKTFITPLRNPKTFALLPGVSIGDIGKKMGRDGIDNGWMYAPSLCVFSEMDSDFQIYAVNSRMYESLEPTC